MTAVPCWRGVSTDRRVRRMFVCLAQPARMMDAYGLIHSHERPNTLLEESALSEVPGRKRRALIRKLIGRPGSIRRWLVGNAIALPLALASLNIYLIISVVLFSTMWIMYLRTTLVEGDEDEMRAWLRWQQSRKNPDRFVPTKADDDSIDSTDWLTMRKDTFFDVPLPPVAEEAGESRIQGDFPNGAR